MDLDTLFDAHYGRIARVIGRVICDQARAEELAVEVFVKWQRNPSAHGEQAEGWLYRTAVREAVDEWRKQARRERFERLFSSLRRSPPTPQQLYEADAQQANVRTVLAAIDQRHAQVLLLWAEDLTYREIAAAAQLNVTSIGSLLSRAQTAFRKEYERRYGNQR
ncbi:MAG: sigma-70 family RNA polymerase sigma factor [Bryobacterales bacterium]|nr:sigma-70 family RNA polymerase sigma factor [Bryobacterales bacterium]